MKSNARENRIRRPSGTFSERVIFYVDDLTTENCQSSTPELYHRSESSYGPYRSSSDCLRLDDRSALYPPAPDNICLELDDRFTLSLPIKGEKPRRNSTCSQSGTNRRLSHNLEVETRSSRRSSVQSGRSRVNSSGRPTPLGRILLSRQQKIILEIPYERMILQEMEEEQACRRRTEHAEVGQRDERIRFVLPEPKPKTQEKSWKKNRRTSSRDVIVE